MTHSPEMFDPGKPSTLFGMDPLKGRWIFVIIGFSMNLCLGSIYSWSVFRKPLQDLFSTSATESLLPFIVFLVMLAVMMLISGGPLDRFGPKKLAILGGILVGLGWYLGSMVTNIWMMTVTYGIIGGSGVGIAFNCPIGVSGRWFPDKRGLAVGLTLAGFGLSSVIMAPVANFLISRVGVLQSFSYIGITFLILVVLLALPLRFPAEGWMPPGYLPPSDNFNHKRDCDISRSELIKTGTFWGLWTTFAIGTLIGLMAVGISSNVGQEIFKLTPAMSAIFVSLFGIFNGAGRPSFGYLMDRWGVKDTAIFNFGIMFLVSLMLVFGAQTGSVVLYALAFAALWFTLGGWVAIAPSATATYFGTKYYGRYYGVVFTAFGVGAVLGNLMAGQIRDLLGSYTPVFLPIALLSLCGAVIAFKYLETPVCAMGETIPKIRHPLDWLAPGFLIPLVSSTVFNSVGGIRTFFKEQLSKNPAPVIVITEPPVLPENSRGMPAGHPLFDLIREELSGTAGKDPFREAVCYDRARKFPGILDVFSATVRDGSGTTLAHRLFVVETADAGSMNLRQPAMIIDLLPGAADAKKPDLPALCPVSRVESYQLDNALKPFRDEVSREHAGHLEEVGKNLETDITGLNDRLIIRLNDLYSRLRKGDTDFLLRETIKNTQNQLDELNTRFAKRRKELELERTCDIGEIVHHGRIWVLPLPDATISGFRITAPEEEIEQTAIRKAIACEESRGWSIQIVKREERGFSLISRKIHPEDPHTATDIRFITVKGFATTGEVALSPYEYMTADRLKNQYWLYVVFDCMTPAPVLHCLQDPGRLGWRPPVKIETYHIGADEIVRAERNGNVPFPPIRMSDEDSGITSSFSPAAPGY